MASSCASSAADVEAGVGAGSAAPAQVTCVSSEQSREEAQAAGGTSSLSDVTFRMLERADLPQVMQLHRDLFPVQYTESFYERLFWDGYFCQVGVSNATGEVVSVASARVVDYLDPNAALPSDEAYIMTLGVGRSYRRLGLGAHQLELMLRLLRTRTNCTRVALHVKSANRAACAFYDRLGFTCNADAGGLLPNHYYLYGEYWDACKYTRQLTSSPLQSFLRGLSLDGCSVL